VITVVLKLSQIYKPLIHTPETYSNRVSRW